MTVFELDSVEIRNPEIVRVLQSAKTISLDKSIFIIGEHATGRTVLAENILKTLGHRGGNYFFKKNIRSLEETKGVGVYTVTVETWKSMAQQMGAISCLLVHMPTLAERKMDLPALSRFSVKVLGLMYAKPQIILTGKALEKILQYSWPGQFHELESVLEKAVSQNFTGFIEPEDLKIDQIQTEIEMPVGLKLDELERKYILQTLYFVHQNRTKAADLLGISIRTLRNKINQYRQEGYL